MTERDDLIRRHCGTEGRTMREYISREAAIKSTWMILEGMGYPRSENRSLERTVEAVFKSAPAADVVEVVRCRECQYFYNGSTKCCTNHVGVVLTDENGFCHHAKRREDEGDNA